MGSSPGQEISDEVLQEGCYYLSLLGLGEDQIAEHFGTTATDVARLVKSYSSDLESGRIVAGDFDRQFWEDVKKEAEGDVKLTFLSDKGFHHSWRSELERLDGRTLMAIYESNKDFVNMDQNQKFLDFPPPKGYDPLALDREVKKAVSIIESLLEAKWKQEGSTQSGSRPP